jgi:hypothetical protein
MPLAVIQVYFDVELRRVTCAAQQQNGATWVLKGGSTLCWRGICVMPYPAAAISGPMLKYGRRLGC